MDVAGESPLMPGARWTDVEIKCAMLWRLSRSHGWANWITADDLVKAVHPTNTGVLATSRTG